MDEAGMRERIARALAVADGKDPDIDWRESDGSVLGFATDSPEVWRTYLPKADAVLEAMMEPDATMASAGMHKLSELPDNAGWGTLVRASVGIWQAMITAARSGSSGEN